MDIDQPAIKSAQRHAQGIALTNAVKFLRDEHVDIFRQQQVNGYIVSLGSEEAEGLYMPDNGSLHWEPPKQSQNQHIELIVQDADDLRFVPYLEPHVQISDKSGTPIVETTLHFMWHPVASHYGANVSLPSEPNDLTYRVTFKAPTFNRHDEILGKRLQESVDISFDHINPNLDREPHGAE